jgi:hypothetical protein
MSTEKDRDLKRIDEAYISQIMTHQQRIDLLKVLQKNIYIAGIDKGTELESCRQERIEKIKKLTRRKKFLRLMDYINDNISEGMKKNNRKHYRSQTYKTKKQKKQEKEIQKIIASARSLSKKHLPPWLINE